MPELDDIEAIIQYLPQTGPAYDLVVRYAMSLADEPIQEATRLADSGVTWILESFGESGPDFETIREIVAAGPTGRT
jgi:hypothetical protein